MLNGFRASLDPLAGNFEPQALNGFGRSHAGFAQEASREMAWAHRHMLGQTFNRKRLVEMLARPGEYRREAAVGPIRLEQ